MDAEHVGDSTSVTRDENGVARTQDIEVVVELEVERMVAPGYRMREVALDKEVDFSSLQQ